MYREKTKSRKRQHQAKANRATKRGGMADLKKEKYKTTRICNFQDCGNVLLQIRLQRIIIKQVQLLLLKNYILLILIYRKTTMHKERTEEAKIKRK